VVSDHTEETRAFLQARLALFWGVMFVMLLLGVVLGVFGAVTSPGPDVALTAGGCALAGAFWALARRGRRSIAFSRALDAGGLVIMFTLGGFIGRIVLGAFAREHGLRTAEGVTMADGYLSMMPLAGMAMQAAIRAALIPSSARRTALVTSVAAAPLIAVTALLVPTADGGLAWRAAGDGTFPWLPGAMVMMWGFGVVTCTVISWVIFGLRREIRAARRLGQYVLEKKLGAGGMGEVYRARHGMMRRPSAIKLLRGDRAGDTTLLERFEREVQLTARLTHPNTITIYDYGRTDDGVFYYAMELLDGATLERVVEVGGAQDPGRVARILTMVCGALHEAHAIGLIHRDIKPANIMLCAQGGELDVVKLLDFGLVKEFAVDGDARLTAASALIGTPLYMAPESIRDPDTVDARTDIYSLGAVAYYLLAGVAVFDGKTVLEVCGQHLHQPPASLASRGVAVPADLEAVVLECLSKDPARRPQSAAELRRRVAACDVEPWEAESARAWWREHRDELQRDTAQPTGEAKTLAVDAARREESDAGIPTHLGL
jgi:serine/threonine-protein kinase